ncbi:MAG: EF-P lysine aminoacylase EpmA [Chromatiales bacterium]
MGGGWRPAATLPHLAARARLLARIRAFFDRAGVMEVETPVCSAGAATDPALESLETRYRGPDAPPGGRLFLQTSPELPMKRLLAAGSGPIYQICRVFRGGERGQRHNPEFTLLEWYRPGVDHHRLMDEVEALVRAVSDRPWTLRRLSYAALFQEHLGVDPHRATAPELARLAERGGVPGIGSLELDGRDAWLDLLLTHCIEPRLAGEGMVFVHDYPASQAALARLRPGDPPVAERFELYLDGVELANGFHELADAAEQRRRFEGDLARRRSRGLSRVPVDERFLQALEAGLPDCAGVALGVDRLLMALTGARSIDEVLAFPVDRA